MKVLQVLPELNSGGVERGTLELAQYLVANGHESYVLSNGGRLVPQLISEGSQHIQLPVHKKSLLTFRYIFAVKSFLEREGFDIVHLRSRMPAWIVYIAWNLMPKAERPKLITTVHGFYSVNPYSAIMTYGEAVICVSKSIKEYVKNKYPSTDTKKLNIVHRGVDVDRYNPEFKPNDHWLKNWEDEHPHLRKKCVLTLPGRLSAWKGHREFIEIIHHLKNESIPVHGLIVGDLHPTKQGYYQSLLQEIKDLKLEDAITFLGHRNDIHEIMSISNLVVSCSKTPEAFGRVTLEALSLGKPVFAYAHGGVKEQLEVLFPEGMMEANKLASMKIKIRHFLQSNNPSTPKINSEFTLDTMNQKILKVYESTLKI